MMVTINSIAAATDLSAPAGHAAERAAAVASVIAARLALVHVASRAPFEQLRELLEATGKGIEQALLERLLSSARCPVLIVKQPPHEPYRHVLVPVDFSPIALRTLCLAAADVPQASLTVMHACELPFEGLMRYDGVETSKRRKSSTIGPRPSPGLGSS